MAAFVFVGHLLEGPAHFSSFGKMRQPAVVFCSRKMRIGVLSSATNYFFVGKMRVFLEKIAIIFPGNFLAAVSLGDLRVVRRVGSGKMRRGGQIGTGVAYAANEWE